VTRLDRPGRTAPGRSAADPWVVAGADGLFGCALAAAVAAGGYLVARTSRRATAGVLPLDLAANPATWALPDRAAVGLLCAAVTSWERCRDDPDGTKLVNVDRTVRLARALAERGARVVFPSSNQVFDGTVAVRPAGDPPNPQTEYGRQKALAEVELLRMPAATVVRFGKVLGAAPGFLRAWGDALLRGEPVEPFADMVLSPVPLAFAAAVMVRAGERGPGGVLQVTGERDVTYSEIAFRLADRLGADRRLVRPQSYTDRGLPAGMAPRHTTLDVGRLRSELDLTPPPVWDTVDAVIRETFRDR
jgi:dTDP-4-dehydrorhamnose reductase